MDQGREEWIARIAAALCAASRWLAVAAIAMTVIAAMRLVLFPPESMLGKLGLSLILVFGAMQIYLAVRIEFDRRVFEFLAERGGGEAQLLAQLDGAMRALRLQSEAKLERDLTERAQGLVSLIQRLGWILVGQFTVLAAVAWLD